MSILQSVPTTARGNALVNATMYGGTTVLEGVLYSHMSGFTAISF